MCDHCPICKSKDLEIQEQGTVADYPDNIVKQYTISTIIMADKFPRFLLRTKRKGKKTVAILYRRRPFWWKRLLEFSSPQEAENYLRSDKDLKVTGYGLYVADCRLEDGKILMKSWILTYNLLQGGSVIPMKEYYYWILKAKIAEWCARHDKHKIQVCLKMVETEI